MRKAVISVSLCCRIEATLLQLFLAKLWAKSPNVPPTRHLASVIALALSLRYPLPICLGWKHLSWLTALGPGGSRLILGSLWHRKR